MERITSKYLDVRFQGKVGALIITSEKVIFRQKLDDHHPEPSSAKPTSRSWRWTAIERVEVLDPSRGSTGRSIKLKSKAGDHKAVTITVPQEVLDELLKDMNRRLGDDALGIEGPVSMTTPLVHKDVPPPALRRSTPEPNSHKKKTPATNNRPVSDPTSPNLSSPKKKVKNVVVPKSPGIVSPRKKTKETVLKKRRKEETAPLIKTKQKEQEGNKHVKWSEVSPAGKESKNEKKSNKEKKSAAPITTSKTPEKRTTNARRSSVPAPAVALSPKKTTKDAVTGTTIQGHRRASVPSSAKFQKNKQTQEELMNDNSLKDETKAHANSTKDNLSGSQHVRPLIELGQKLVKASVKYPLLKPPDKYRQDSRKEEEEKNVEGEAEQFPSSKDKFLGSSNHFRPLKEFGQKIVKPGLTSLSLLKSQGKGYEDEEDDKSFAEEDELDMSSSHTKSNKKRGVLHFLKPPPPRRNITDELEELEEKARELKEQERLKAQAERVAKANAAMSPVVSPQKTKRPSAASPAAKFASPHRDIVFTPPQPPKEKVMAAIKPATVYTPPPQPKQKAPTSKPPADIVFTPTKAESKSSGDDDATNTTTSSHEPEKEGAHKPSGVLWNPDAPEHKFRMMILHHAATCDKHASCPYNPICAEYRHVLEHIETCNDPECGLERCRPTRDFLVTMRLMTEGNGEHEQGPARDFLIAVGAVAPVPVIHVGNDEDLIREWEDAFSVVSDSPWWDEVNA